MFCWAWKSHDLTFSHFSTGEWLTKLKMIKFNSKCNSSFITVRSSSALAVQFIQVAHVQCSSIFTTLAFPVPSSRIPSCTTSAYQLSTEGEWHIEIVLCDDSDRVTVRVAIVTKIQRFSNFSSSIFIVSWRVLKFRCVEFVAKTKVDSIRWNRLLTG